MAAASLHRFLFLTAAITAFMALSASPAAATLPKVLKPPPSSLIVRHICKNELFDYNLCVKVLTCAEAKSAQDLKALSIVVMKLAGRSTRATHAAISQMPEFKEGKTTPALALCRRKFGQAAKSFTKIIPELMKGDADLTLANQEIKSYTNFADECDGALAESKFFSPIVSAGTQALRQFCLLGFEVTKLCKEDEQGSLNLGPGSAPSPSQ